MYKRIVETASTSNAERSVTTYRLQTVWWMNLPIPFAPQVVRANFETIMRWGREGLERKLGMPVDVRRQ